MVSHEFELPAKANHPTREREHPACAPSYWWLQDQATACSPDTHIQIRRFSESAQDLSQHGGAPGSIHYRMPNTTLTGPHPVPKTELLLRQPLISTISLFQSPSRTYECSEDWSADWELSDQTRLPFFMAVCYNADVTDDEEPIKNPVLHFHFPFCCTSILIKRFIIVHSYNRPFILWWSTCSLSLSQYLLCNIKQCRQKKNLIF